MRVLCGTSAQYRFYTGPIRKAGFARDRNAGFIRDPYARQVLYGISNTASFLRPFMMLAETSKQISA